MDWKDYKEIAVELHKRYPNETPIGMPEAELVKLVTSLPGFTGTKQPSEEIYTNFISKRWIIVRSGGSSWIGPEQLL
ncbi:MAG: Fe-S cluster assembly protein IscX [Treponema sp.]|nr:Fe-S cluster assembly protein IscX [Treponema sp.]